MKATFLVFLLCACGQSSPQHTPTFDPALPGPSGQSGDDPRHAEAKAPANLLKIDETREKLRAFLNALATVESHGKDDAIGDNGNALGRYQIWEIYWHDAVEYCPELGGRYKDVTNKEYAERVVVAYLMRYGRKFVEGKDYQSLARIHNGGPKGYKSKSTLGYWRKVEAILKY